MKQGFGVGENQFSVHPGVLICVDPTDLPDHLTQRTEQLHALLALMSDKNFELWRPDVKLALRNLAESLGAELKHLVPIYTSYLSKARDLQHPESDLQGSLGIAAESAQPILRRDTIMNG